MTALCANAAYTAPAMAQSATGHVATYALTDWTASPQPESTIVEFESLSLTFPGASEVTINDDLPFTAFIGASDYAQNFSLDLEATHDNRVVIVYSRTAQSALPSSGVFEFSFPAGYFVLDTNTLSTPITVNFTVNPRQYDAASVADYFAGVNMPVTNYPFRRDNSTLAGSFASGIFELATTVGTTALAVNHECAAPAVVKRNGETFANISASTTPLLDVTEPCCYVENADATHSNRIMVDLRKQITTDGLYTISFPAGFFKNPSTGELLNGTTVKYAAGIGSFTPADGETVNLSASATEGAIVDGALTKLFLQCYAQDCVLNEDFYGSDEEVHDAPIFTGSSAKASLTKTIGGVTTQIASFTLGTPQVAMNKGRVLFNLTAQGNTPITEDGEYTLTLPATFFRVNLKPLASILSRDDIKEVQDEFVLKFKVEGGVNPDIAYELTSPAAGSYNPFPTVTITYPNAQRLIVPAGTKAQLYFNSVATTPEHELNVTASGNVLTITPATPITVPAPSEYAVYRLEIPAGTFTIEANGKTYANTHVKITDIRMKAAPSEVPTPTIAVNPENLKEDLMEFDMLFDQELARFNFMASVALWAKQDDGSFKRVNTYALSMANDKRSIHCILKGSVKQNPANAMTEVPIGDYELRIPAGTYYVTVNGTQKGNTAMVYPFSVQANTSADAATTTQTYTVYTLTGIRILSNAPADALRALPAGLYIINGAKVKI